MLEVNKIHKGDCLELMKEIPDGSIDLIFVDPWYYPENQKTRNAFENDVFWEITEKWVSELLRLINKDKGHIFIAFSPQKMAKLEFLLSKFSAPLQSRIVWHYRNAGGRATSPKQFGKTWDMIYHIGYGDLYIPEKWSDENFDVWTISIPQSNYKDKKVHPFQKPLDLLRKIINYGSKEGDLVLDCFGGAGTTALACKELGRNFILIEKEKRFIDMANKRLSQEVLL